MQIKTKIVSYHTAKSKPAKQEVNSTVILSPLVFLALKGHIPETAKIGLIFAVRPILPGRPSDFCKHPTDGHHIAQNQTEI